ncbi:RNA polymerase sigma factor, sigma-70 family [Arthrobacter sp. cf158]|uniref:RNA polymerase sigma factor n=1 Tax=Arthrobacter sp. cf158 TaxID=1761744 RepID=UPI00089B80D5|nr:RNA polymerase sigma factor [Arthrobacter sp. cf158]SDW56941.1 RNA polymerase sigma factor, sigma-70 family [Arthrobacter sp. cf158]
MSSSAARAAVDAVWRSESARIVGALARYTGDFTLAEDLAQEAVAEALVAWSVNGLPAEPVGWLLTAGQRRAIDMFRRRAAQEEKYALLASGLSGEEPGVDALFNPEAIDDDVLTLMFIACHPVLSREARVALTLRVVGGMGTEEIARAFLVPVPTIQARITRAKKTLAAAHIPFVAPELPDIPERLGSVLQVVYLIFSEGAFASGGDSWMRTELASEARRLARVLARLAPEPEVFGLLALMELTAARFPARLDPAGNPVLLEDQDRRRWDQSAVRRGRAALKTAVGAGRGLGAYGLQASIAECHAMARSAAETDWQRIVILYEALGQLTPSPVVELNRAVAVAMASGPSAGLAMVDSLADSGVLNGSHLLPTVRGELLTRLGRVREAKGALLEALRLCSNAAERTALERKISELPGQ